MPTNSESRDGAVLFRGTQTGLEIHVDSNARFEAIHLALIEKLETSSSFFKGARVTIRFSGDPISGILADLEAILQKYHLIIASVRSLGDEQKLKLRSSEKVAAAPEPEVAKTVNIKVVELVEQILQE